RHLRVTAVTILPATFGSADVTTKKKTIGYAFGGQLTTIEEQRAIWKDALPEDAIWEVPMFETPVQFIGAEACGHFFELLLSVVPRVHTTLVRSVSTHGHHTH